MSPRNLYVHFPFCRRKCTYCALYSRAGVAQAERDAYVRLLAKALADLGPGSVFNTVYFGGGSPALCDLTPLFAVLASRRTPETEFTVELHPLDVTAPLLEQLRAGGVNRISMGVQSLDDATLAKMGRGYTVVEARKAFELIRPYFDNAGIDLIVGYPGDPCAHIVEALRDWGLQHCSVYSLILEEKSILQRQITKGVCPPLPSDDEVLDRIAAIQRDLAEIGLERYEISNYSVTGRECRHNLATWRGEDYLGLGAGAFGRVGLKRTQNWGLSPAGFGGQTPFEETVTPEADRKERTLFRLRTREGLETRDYPQWEPVLTRFVDEGLLSRAGTVYRLRERGTEVCDAILAELV